MTERLLTIVFTDVEGSTALRSARGDVEAQMILQACDELVRQQVQAHDGRALKSLGDGLMVTFESPRRAVACALAVQNAIAERARWQSAEAVRVRVGIHTGEVVEEAGDLSGSAVHAAARIAAKAKGGEILISEVVRQLSSGLVDATFEDRGRVTLKGFPDRWHLYLVAPSASESIAPAGQRTPFVGREAERVELRTLLEQSYTGHGSLVMISGEPGVGKTRLSEEMAAEGRRRGFRVFVGHCYEREADLPYMPWVEIMEAAAKGADLENLRRALGDAAPDLARLVPLLLQVLPNLPPPVELPPDQQRRHIFTSISDYITRVASIRPQLYVLEDLHWADESTLLFLQHVVERLSAIPVLIIGTHRNSPTEVSPVLAETLSALVRRRHVRRLSLRPHREAEVAAMLCALTGHSAPPAVSAAIHAETDGNAFFVEEVFRHLVESGQLLDDRGDFRTDLRIDELDVPGNVRLVTDQRLDRLSEPTRQMLSVAAVIGRRFSFTILEAVAQTPGEQLFDAIEEAEHARLIITEPSERTANFSFAHELIRQTLIGRLALPRRQRLHLRIADALEKTQTYAQERAADIAHHLLQAGEAADRSRTAQYLTMAGERALAAVAFEDALRDFGHALSILPADEPRRRADILLKVGLAQRSLRRWDETVATWNETLSILEAVGEVDSVATLCWDFSFQLVWANRFSEAQAVAERGLSVSEDRPASRARLLAMRATGLGEAGRFEEAAGDIAEARRLAGALHDERLMAEVALGETVHHYLFMQLPQLVEAGRRAVAGLREAGALWNLADALIFLDVAWVFQGRFAESDELNEELEPLAREIGHLGAQVILGRNRFPKVAAMRADLSELDELSLTQAELVHSMGAHWVAYANTQRGVVHFWKGDWARARTDMDEGVRLAFPGFWYGIHHGFLFLLLAASGERDAAHGLFGQVAETLPRAGRGNTMGAWSLASLAAEGAGLLGDVERSRVLHPLVAEDLGRGTVIRQYDGALLQRAAGMAAAAAGLRDTAEEHFETALRQAQELPHLMEGPAVRHFYASFLIDRCGSGDLERAHTLLDEAVAGYRTIGMPRHEAMAQQLLAACGTSADTHQGPR